jgi:SagB-type dehydrogenase family enzyme
MRRARVYRRPPTLVVHWRHGELVARDYAAGVERVVSPEDVRLLAALTWWTDAAGAGRAIGAPRARAASALDRLVAAGLVERGDRPPDRRRAAMAAWSEWSPDAALFHFGTKDVRRIDRSTIEGGLEDRIAVDPPPPAIKPQRRKRIALPAFPRGGTLPRVLLARRSWRLFGPGPVALRDVATLVGLTWGVQRWMRISGGVRAALKTSPSAGACHPIEMYLVAQQVRGLPRGIYHYEPDEHAVSVVRRPIGRDTAGRILNGQRWFAGCAALFVMTAVFPRVQWKYPSARAYRTVLLDAGHLGQTFCLLATSLGLAPFCSASIADSRTERLLRIDGVRESVVYAVGVGRRPRGTAWAPWPEDYRIPATSLPAHAAAAQRPRRPRRQRA